MYKSIRRSFSAILTIAFIMLSVIQPVSAAIIGTDALLGNESSVVVTENQIQQLRQQVSQVLIDHGVEAGAAVHRSNSLSHLELQALQNRINELPAGQGALGLLGAVFLVLIVLEFLGVINVFARG